MTVKLHASGHNRIDALPVNDRGKMLSWCYDFAENPRGSGHQLHRVENAQGLWTARVDDDYRAVLIQDGPDWCVVYVGRHDDAYRWAEGRQVTAADGEIIIEFTSKGLREIAVQSVPEAILPTPPILPKDLVSDATLASWGLSASTIEILRSITDYNTLDEFATGLSEGVADRVLGVACGESTGTVALITDAAQPDEELDYVRAKLDIRRTFYIIDGNDDLMRVIGEPMASWVAFLHPSQHRVAYGKFSGPVKVSGGAGTGKTVVALHRARHLARQGHRVLLTTYADTLCANLREQLAILCSSEELVQIRVSTVHEVALGLLEQSGRKLRPDREGQTEKWLKDLADYGDYARSPEWYVMEWEHVIHAHGIRSLDQYLEVSRGGRGSALQEPERRVVWGIFEQLFAKLDEAGITDWATICMMAREGIENGSIERPADTVVVDEMQDLRPQELRFLSVLPGRKQDGLMVVGDMTQRIIVPRFSMRSGGIDVVGRSFCLRINYRTTRQIKVLADAVVAGAPGHKGPDGAVSIYQGPKPRLCAFANPSAEAAYVGDAIRDLLASDEFEAHEIAVFARSASRLKPVIGALQERDVASYALSRKAPPDGHVRVGSMLRAKGLEFKAVFVVGVSGEEVPDPATVHHLFEPAALEEAMERERQLLHVALTRARDDLTVTWTGEPSVFLPTQGGPETTEGACK